MSCRELYEVDQIIGKKILYRRPLYLVRWRGFSSEHDSWEPATHLSTCKLLIKAFNKGLSRPANFVSDGNSAGAKRTFPLDDTPSAVLKSPPAKKQKLLKGDKCSEKLDLSEESKKAVIQLAETTNAGSLKRKNGKAKQLFKFKTPRFAIVNQFKGKLKKSEETGKNSETLKQKTKGHVGRPKQKPDSTKAQIHIVEENGKIKIVKLVKGYPDAKGNSKQSNASPDPEVNSTNKKVKKLSLEKGGAKKRKQNTVVDSVVQSYEIVRQSSDPTKELLDIHNQQCDINKPNGQQAPKQKGISVLKQSKDVARSKQTAATPEKNDKPALVDLTKSPGSDSIYITSSESIEISDDDDNDDDGEDVLYSLNPACDFIDDKQVSESKSKGHKESSNSSDSSASSQSSVIEINNTKSQGAKGNTKNGVSKKKKRMSLMDSKKKETFWEDNSEELLRPVSPSPPFTSVKEPSGSPDNPDPSKPSGPDPVSPEASETYLAETYLADVPTSFSVTGDGSVVGEDEPLSPGSVSYKSFLQNLPGQLHHIHKGGKKGKVVNGRPGFNVQRNLSASSGIGAVERRTSVRTTECAFRYKQIMVKKCFRFTQIWLNTHTVMQNALNPSVIQEIISAMNSAKYDDSHLVLFAGFGPVFCSGTDLHYLITDDRRLAARQMAERIRELTKTFITFPKPIIAAVSGAAVGLGVALLLLCDVVYASDKASFHLPYSQLSQTPEGCSSFTLPQTLGLPSANELLFGGRKITAMEAYQLGLVSQVFWPTLMMQEVIPRAQNMAASSAKALEATKLLIRSHHRTKMELTNETECNLLLERWLSVDCQQAIEAYLANEKNWAS